MKKQIVTIAAVMGIALGAGAQNTTEMKKDTTKTAMQKIEDGVVGGYKAIEEGVVSGYTAIQDGVVEGFTRVSDAFIMRFFARKGETLEQAKERMKAEEEKIRKESADRTAGSRQQAEEAGRAARKKAGLQNK